MTSTNVTLNSTKKELKYQWYSHIIWIVVIISVFISLLNIYNLKSKAASSYELYVKTYNLYKEEGMDVDKMLDMPINISGTGSEQVVDNPVRYRLAEAGDAIGLLKNSSIITNTLEWMTFVFFPIIFVIYSIYIASYDYKYKTIRIKATQMSSSKLITSKLLSLYLGVLIIFVTTTLVSFMAGYLFHQQLINEIPNDILARFNTSLDHNNLIVQLLFSLMISLIFASIGFLLGILFKSALIPVILFFVYDFIVPVLGKYDIRNIISVIAHDIFDFKGRFQLFKPTPVSEITSFSILIIVFVLSILLSYVCFSRQSKYSM
ncbi:hypothetical protein C0Q44_17290 [Paenibacillus sp. PCH8]|uniref:ABC transporter permease subunit n=1 Tax=Paenibacillus sp. PCH8 TaxID=2066524 RepID=UPI000CFA55BD|nr:ABC transporter permease subunit [Paenibacillus sp. PCH8]PQP83090.1 hypothetical protein C0Q44_17290 [Paenibacillus sp. PCH8]